MAKNARIALFGIHNEATQNTPAAITASTDFLLASAVDFKPGFDSIELDYKRNSIDSLQLITGKQWSEFTVTTQLRNLGATGNPPLEAALRSCGFTGSNASSTSSLASIPAVNPAGMQSPAVSSTVNIYRADKLHSIKGAIADCKMTFEAGKPVPVEFSGKGLLSSSKWDYDAATPSASLYETTLPPIVQSIGLSIGAYTPIGVTKLEVNFGVDVQPVDDVNSALGLYSFIKTGHKPVGSIDPLADTVANHDAFGSLQANTEFAINIRVGSVAGNVITFSFPSVQYSSLSYSERNGALVLNSPLRFNGTAGPWCTIRLM